MTHSRTLEQVFDDYLVLCCQDGSAAAFERLVARWDARLLRHSHRLTGSHDGARDALQEAWLAISRGLRRLDDPARFRAWAYRIVTHKATDWIRREARHRRLAADAAEHARASSGAGDSGDIAALRIEIDRLDEAHRVPLGLYYLDQLTVAEIAHALDLPVGTVKSRLHHARNRLKVALQRRAE